MSKGYKNFFVICMLGICTLCSACGGAIGQEDSEVTKDVEKKEIIFRNVVTLPYVDLAEETDKTLMSYKLTDDMNELYAFEVVGWTCLETDDTNSDKKRESLEQAILHEGFYIVADYPDERLVFAGTAEQFDKEYSIYFPVDKYGLSIVGAERPDLEEIMMEYGWTESTEKYEWWLVNKEVLADALGSKEEQILMEVAVVVPMEVQQ